MWGQDMSDGDGFCGGWGETVSRAWLGAKPSPCILHPSSIPAQLGSGPRKTSDTWMLFCSPQTWHRAQSQLSRQSSHEKKVYISQIQVPVWLLPCLTGFSPFPLPACSCSHRPSRAGRVKHSQSPWCLPIWVRGG